MVSEERETTIAYTDAYDTINIYTCIRKDITAMKKKEQFVLIDEGAYPDGTIWAKFEISRDKFDIARAAKGSRNLSEEQRAALSARMSKQRKPTEGEENE